MAEMIPESIASRKEATSGEKRVFRVLRDALRPDEEYIVWFEPKTAALLPDFLVWSEEWGLLIIEVKDWSISRSFPDDPQSQILDVTSERWTVRLGGVEQKHDNPVQQARKCFLKYKELIQKSPDLLQADGSYQGSLKFPIGYCAAFTQITRQQAEESRIVHALGPAYCLFSDDLNGNFDSAPLRREFVSKLKRAFRAWFPFDPLTAAELKTLRYLIFPEVRIHSTRSGNAAPLRLVEHGDRIRALDLEQERTAKSILEGHRVLKGVAGSGKTLVLTCRAKYLRKIQPNWRILIVCYNRSLCRYIQQMLAVSKPGYGNDAIEVYHYHGLIKALTGANMGKLESESKEEWQDRMCAILRRAIGSGTLNASYDAILIDEGQDFAVEWLQSLTELLDERSNSLLFCLDPAQNIFGRKVTYKSAGIQVVGKRPTLLSRSYRNTTEILHLARKFSKVLDTKSNFDEESVVESLLFPIDIDRHGPTPRIMTGLKASAQIQFVLNEIADNLDSGDLHWEDIGVLYTSKSYLRFVESFRSAFVDRFGAERLYWISESQASKTALDLSSPSVKLSTIESAKGMEFRLVFLVGLEILPRPKCDEASERMLTYVGLTRAQDLLYILASETRGFVKELNDIVQAGTPPHPARL
ncbi:MAG: AAA family ATPase [Acidobacteriota bacterium]|nr:AAA family ATPase [Acidobacteriota bacterium]